MTPLTFGRFIIVGFEPAPGSPEWATPYAKHFEPQRRKGGRVVMEPMPLTAAGSTAEEAMNNLRDLLQAEADRLERRRETIRQAAAKRAQARSVAQ
jgi:hypothetical protein